MPVVVVQSPKKLRVKIFFNCFNYSLHPSRTTNNGSRSRLIIVPTDSLDDFVFEHLSSLLASLIAYFQVTLLQIQWIRRRYDVDYVFRYIGTKRQNQSHFFWYVSLFLI
jgi:hypothetical protein